MKEKQKRDILSYLPMTRDKFDPLGSYTGIPVDVTDSPVQDADDV